MNNNLVAQKGFEPLSLESNSSILPLDDRAKFNWSFINIISQLTNWPNTFVTHQGIEPWIQLRKSCVVTT